MRAGVLIGSLALFATASALPALAFQHSETGAENLRGGELLATGWMAVLAGQFAWLANPLWLAGLVCLFLRRHVSAAVLAGLALAFAVHTLALFTTPLPADEGDVNHLMLLRLLVGYYLWLASMAVLLVGAIVACLRKSA